ncbi:MAG: Jag N-terminal domain-containing protein, partial [Acidimicrobiia bacterium]
MEWVETTGRSIDEALELALDQLGVLEDEVEFEVLVEPKAGLFGRFGGTEARLRARVKPVSREKPGERRRGRKPRKSGSGAGSGSGDGASTRPARGSGAAAGAGEGLPPRSGHDESPRPRRRRGGRSRGSGGGGGDNRPTVNGRASKRPVDEGDKKMSDEPEISVEEQTEAAEEFTRGLVDSFRMEAVVSAGVDDEILLVDVRGENLGLLVGPRGATLQAIEELVRTVANRGIKVVMST